MLDCGLPLDTSKNFATDFPRNRQPQAVMGGTRLEEKTAPTLCLDGKLLLEPLANAWVNADPP